LGRFFQSDIDGDSIRYRRRALIAGDHALVARRAFGRTGSPKNLGIFLGVSLPIHSITEFFSRAASAVEEESGLVVPAAAWGLSAAQRMVGFVLPGRAVCGNSHRVAHWSG